MTFTRTCFHQVVEQTEFRVAPTHTPTLVHVRVGTHTHTHPRKHTHACATWSSCVPLDPGSAMYPNPELLCFRSALTRCGWSLDPPPEDPIPPRDHLMDLKTTRALFPHNLLVILASRVPFFLWIISTAGLDASRSAHKSLLRVNLTLRRFRRRDVVA